MGVRSGRAAVHVAAVSAIAAGALLWGGGPGAAADARPASFGGTTTATGYHAVFDTAPELTPVADLFHIDAPYAEADLDSSGGAEASAASFFPGQGLLGVPALLCQAGVPCKQLPSAPDYPLMATASYPTDKDARAQASGDATPVGPASVSPSVVTAHADPDTVHSMAQAAGAGVAGVFVADAVHVETDQHFDKGVFVVTSRTVLKGVDIGGAVHIDSLTSVAVAKIDGQKVSSATATTTASGVTAGGQAAAIDDRGIHALDKNSDALAQVNKALQNLASQGITARLVPPAKKATKTDATASTSGLLITFKHTVSGTPPVPPCVLPPPPPPLPAAPCGVVNANRDYFGTVSLGGAGAGANADNSSDSLDLPMLGGGPGVTGGGGGGAPAGTGAAAAANLPASSATTAGGGAGSAPVVASSAGNGQQGVERTGLAATITSRRVKLLALLLLAYPLVVLVGSRLHVPSRLPAGR